MLLETGFVGEIKRGDGGFIAEVRGLANASTRSAAGSIRAPARPISATRAAASPLTPGRRRPSPASDGRARSDGAGAGGLSPDGHFTGGRLVFTGGANVGFATEVKRHPRATARSRSSSGRRAPQPIAPGDAFTVTAGCDKRFATCRAKFANGVNFRGFPHMPGNDFIIGGVRPGDGAARWREPVPMSAGVHADADRRGGARWIGTPYRHQASLRGVGCDCLGLVRGVWRELYGPRAGGRCRPIRPTGPRPAAREALAAAGAAPSAAGRRCGAERPGDVLLFRWRAHLPAKHCAILGAPDAHRPRP